jgi:hypothetical protein
MDGIERQAAENEHLFSKGERHLAALILANEIVALDAPLRATEIAARIKVYLDFLMPEREIKAERVAPDVERVSPGAERLPNAESASPKKGRRHLISKFGDRCLHCGTPAQRMSDHLGECEIVELQWLKSHVQNVPAWANPDVPIYDEIARLTAVIEDLYGLKGPSASACF